MSDAPAESGSHRANQIPNPSGSRDANPRFSRVCCARPRTARALSARANRLTDLRAGGSVLIESPEPKGIQRQIDARVLLRLWCFFGSHSSSSQITDGFGASRWVEDGFCAARAKPRQWRQRGRSGRRREVGGGRWRLANPRLLDIWAEPINNLLSQRYI